MKKLLLALALGALLILAIATTVTADNGPHGGFAANTDACANCHRTHSAQVGSNSLLVMNEEDLCLSCHDGAGAGTDVVDGVYTQNGTSVGLPAGSGSAAYKGFVEGSDGKSLFGGGFRNALMATNWGGGAATSKPTTSAHGTGVGAGWALGIPGSTVWGSGYNNGVNGTMALECTSCHNPHGKSGYTNASTPAGTVCDPTLAAAGDLCNVKVASYRLLRFTPLGSGGFSAPSNGVTTATVAVNWSGGAFPVSSGTTTGWTVPDFFTTEGQEWYTIGTLNAFAEGDYSNGSTTTNVSVVGTQQRGTYAYNVRNPLAAGTTTYLPASANVSYFCAQCHDRYFNNSRLRNMTDVSLYCGEAGTIGTLGVPASVTFSNALLADVPDADAKAPWIYPGDAAHQARCLEVVSTTTGKLTGWGDNGDSGDSTYMYRHNSGDVLRNSSDGSSTVTVNAATVTTNTVGCVSCHVSHGTTAAMTTVAGSVADPITNKGGSLAGGSTLLRMDNRSICLRCHANGIY